MSTNSEASSDSKASMPITGERMVSQLFDVEHGKEDVLDHLHRYARAFEFVVGKEVLDIASGEGYGSFLLAQHARHVVGVDISQEAVDFAKSKYKSLNLDFMRGSADLIPLKDSSVDVVVSFETLEHHDRHEEMLREVKRVLRPGGVLIMSTPDRDFYRVSASKNEYHVKELNLQEFRSLVERHFTYCSMLYQRYIEASFLCPEDGSEQFLEFQGDFLKIAVHNRITRPNYNVCLASDNVIDKPYSSIFHNYQLKQFVREREEVAQELEKERERAAGILHSKTYRLGHYLTLPLRVMRNLIS